VIVCEPPLPAGKESMPPVAVVVGDNVPPPATSTPPPVIVPVIVKGTFQAPAVPPERVTGIVTAEPLKKAVDVAVEKAKTTGAFGSTMLTFVELGEPRLAPLAVSVMAQVAPAVAVPALTVSEAGVGVAEPSANETDDPDSVQPPEIPRVPVAVPPPAVMPVRETAIVVEPEVTGMLPAVPEVLRLSTPGCGVVLPPEVQVNTMLPPVSPEKLP